MENMPAPEFESVENFAEFLMEDERTSFTFAEARTVAEAARMSTNKVIAELEGYGLKYAGRPVGKKVRGFTSNNHDRWIVSGNCGGSGHEQINGFSGREG